MDQSEKEAENKVREAMKYALKQMDHHETYEKKKSYFRCTLPLSADRRKCGFVGNFGQVSVHMSKHWAVTRGQCTRCEQDLYDVVDIFGHKDKNLPNMTCKHGHHTSHTPSNWLAHMQWRARNIFIKEISKNEYDAWKDVFEKRYQSRAATPAYDDNETNGGKQTAPAERFAVEGNKLTSSALAAIRELEKERNPQSQQSSSNSNSVSRTGAPGISQGATDPRLAATATSHSERRSEIQTEAPWNPGPSTSMGMFNGSFGQSQQNGYPNNSQPTTSAYAAQNGSLQFPTDPRNWNSPTQTPQPMATAASLYSSAIPGSNQYPSASAPVDPLNWNTPPPAPQTMATAAPLYPIPGPQQYPSAAIPQFRMIFNTSHTPMQQTNVLQQIPLPSSAPMPVPPPQESRGAGRSRVDIHNTVYNGPTTRSQTPGRSDRDEAIAAAPRRQPLLPFPTAPVVNRRTPSAVRDRSPVQRQHVAQGTVPPPRVTRSGSRVPESTTPPLPPSQNTRRRSSVGRDVSPVQHPPSSQPVSRGAAQPPPQNIRRRQASAVRESVEEIAMKSGLKRSRPSRCSTPVRETTPEPSTEQQADGPISKVSLKIVKPQDMTRQRRSSVSYRSTSRGRSSSRHRDEEKADMEKIRKERQLERSKGASTVKVPPSNNRQFMLSNQPTLASNPPAQDPKTAKADRLRQKLVESNSLASNPLYGTVSQQPSTSNAYNQRGNQQPSTSTANTQRYNQDPSPGPPSASLPVSARTRSRVRSPSHTRSDSRSRSRSRSPSPFTPAARNQNGNRRSNSRGNQRGNRGYNQSQRGNYNNRQNNNWHSNSRRF